MWVLQVESMETYKIKVKVRWRSRSVYFFLCWYLYGSPMKGHDPIQIIILIKKNSFWKKLFFGRNCFLFLNITKWVTLQSEDKTEKKNRIETLSFSQSSRNQTWLETRRSYREIEDLVLVIKSLTKHIRSSWKQNQIYRKIQVSIS